jgi:hypothetical protein
LSADDDDEAYAPIRSLIAFIDMEVLRKGAPIMNRIGYTVALLGLAALVFGGVVYSHPGGTNASGCHTNHKTGDYHCHNAKTPAPGNVSYCHVVNGESRCGYAESTCKQLVRNYGGYCAKE